MSSSATVKRTSGDLQHQTPPSDVIEEKDASAKASASAGLNLNVFGALSAAFSGKSTKTMEADGSAVEQREENAAVSGAGMGNASAMAQARAEQSGREMRAAIQESNAA